MENADLKAEADALSARADLSAAFSAYADWFIGGSYRCDLMCWRDLDVYVLDPALELGACFRAAHDITRRLQAVKARFTDHRAGQPAGYYWGILLGNARAGAWKLDVWFVGPSDFTAHRDYADELRTGLSAEERAAILRLKEAYWASTAYRDTITSHQIYEAVRRHGIRTREEFERHCSGPT